MSCPRLTSASDKTYFLDKIKGREQIRHCSHALILGRHCRKLKWAMTATGMSPEDGASWADPASATWARYLLYIYPWRRCLDSKNPWHPADASPHAQTHRFATGDRRSPAGFRSRLCQTLPWSHSPWLFYSGGQAVSQQQSLWPVLKHRLDLLPL